MRADVRGQGYGSALMAALERVIRAAYDLGALGATDEAAQFYASRGWVRWGGPTYALTPTGVVRTAEDDDGVFVLPVSVLLDLTGSLTLRLARRLTPGSRAPGQAAAGVRRQRVAPEDQVGGALGDRDRRGVRVAARHGRHDRGVDDAQPVDAAHAALLVDDRRVVDAHRARADRVVERLAVGRGSRRAARRRSTVVRGRAGTPRRAASAGGRRGRSHGPAARRRRSASRSSSLGRGSPRRSSGTTAGPGRPAAATPGSRRRHQRRRRS